ncbi:hypothetical protein B0T21DRAFT_122847 [Apiosordaria backusii]|uniref:HNH nuclease domain-containing protein n=1 Tax=Apiosordaria backusii TaxID=314023 RepID=A0AA40K111_9PEZI|nr:hypothetical protein B0T21DRAFT_122847 [Apiosordaria backusii]
MAPKRKAAAYEPLPIEAKFVFNRPIDWMPHQLAALPGIEPSTSMQDAYTSPDDDGSQPSGSRLPTTHEELKQRFAAFIQGEIVARTTKINKGRREKSANAEKVKVLSAIRAVTLDPSSRLYHLHLHVDCMWRLQAAARQPESPDKIFQRELTSCISIAQSIMGTWVNKPVDTLNTVVAGERGEETSTDDTEGEAEGPSPADKAAQRTVPPWYQNRCALTGVEAVDAAHIVDVQAIKSMHDPAGFWSILQLFWPLEDIQQLEFTGYEERNILSLQPTAHRLWDRHKFALRPIQHPTSP